MKYLPFRLYHRIFGNILAKHGQLPKHHRDSVTKVWNWIFNHEEDTTGHIIEFWTMAAEYHWLYPNQRHAIFPESVELCEQLQRARFEVGKGASLDFPYEVFSVFMPKGVKFGGQQANSFLVQFMPWSARAGQAQCLQHDSGNSLMRFADKHHNDNQMCLALYYMPLNTQSRMNSVVVRVSDLMDLLSAEDPNAFYKVLGFMGGRVSETHRIYEPDDKDLLYQKDLLRFVVSMMMYYSARDGQGLTKGVPSAQPNQITDKGVTFAAQTLRAIPSMRATAGAHVRAMHFRNLRAERFYQGEHEGKPMGSRWTLVKETTVNPANMKSETLK